MKKIFLLVLIICCLALIAGGALFEKTIIYTEPVYTLAQFNQVFGYLETYYGDCATIFEEEGAEIVLCDVAFSFSKSAEVAAVQAVTNDPDITELEWQTLLFEDGAIATYFPSTYWSDMFDTLTQNQFNVLLDKVIAWNPLPFDDTRTFVEFRTWVLSE